MTSIDDVFNTNQPPKPITFPMDIVQMVLDGLAHVEWLPLTSVYNGHKLVISVMRDAAKFDNVPALTWNRQKVPGNSKTYNGVRLPSTAEELQKIAFYANCMLLTPKIIDLIWVAAGKSGTQFDSVVNVHGQIDAISNINDVHEAVEAAIKASGGDIKGFIDAVGKYWVIVNELLTAKYGTRSAANYGWLVKHGGNGSSVLNVGGVWQTIGTWHDCTHEDPSQVIRLMYRAARLLRADSNAWETVDLFDIASNAELAPLISHEGVLKITYMACVAPIKANMIWGDPIPNTDNLIV